MQRMFNLSKWTEVTEGKALEFRNPKPRKVQLDVNAPEKVALYCVDPDNKNTEIGFLALVEGRDCIEFYASGPFAIVVDGGSAFVYTVDGEDVAFHNPAAETFTRIAERRRRSPEVEYIMTMMHANLNRRLEQQANEFNGALERRTRAFEQQLEAARAHAAARAGLSGVPGEAAPAAESVGGKPADAGGVGAGGKPQGGPEGTPPAHASGKPGDPPGKSKPSPKRD